MTSSKPIIKIRLQGVLSFKYKPEAMKVVLKKTAAVVRGFLQKRFDEYSKGGGNWPPLKPATVKRKGSRIILRDRGYLFAALNPVFMPGGPAFENITPKFAEFGYEDAFPHPTSHGASIAKIVEYHHKGNESKGLPSRKILVEPSDETMRQVAAIVEKTELISPGPPTFIE